MWRLTKEVEIDAAHFLPQYDGKCAQLHGHRWTITFDLTAGSLDEQGMVVDFSELKALANCYDHKCINEVPPFNNPEFPPTAEHIARALALKVKTKWPHVEHIEVTVEETPGSEVSYRLERDV